MKKKTFALSSILAVVIAAFALSGCNTAEGFGRDVEQGGEAIQRGAN